MSTDANLNSSATSSSLPNPTPATQTTVRPSPTDNTTTATATATATATSSGGFRRQRASRACETCHARKVRCDAASLGVPCTNCVAFHIKCQIPTPRRKRAQTAPGQARDSDSDHGEVGEVGNAGDAGDAGEVGDNAGGGGVVIGAGDAGNAGDADNADDAGSVDVDDRRLTFSVEDEVPDMLSSPAPSATHSARGMPNPTMTQAQLRKDEVDKGTYLNLVMKPKITRSPITEAGRVAYLGESSNLTLLVQDRQGTTDVVHYPLPENIRGSSARLTELDQIEIDILKQRGAFLLPPRSLCDELIEAYFRWIHPIVPVINRTRFMRQYEDPKNPPSLLLLQAVLLAGSRVCSNAQLMDANGSTSPAALTFYRRAKALYDANYEDDRVTIVQSLLLMGWYWEGPEDVTKNVFYWSKVATIVAQGSGMHRSVEGSQLSTSDKRLWKRIWWTLFSRDRSVAVAFGRPVHIYLEDSDVDMLTEDDFIEDEPDCPSEYPPDPVHVQYFMQYVKLCEIMGLVLSQYSAASKARPRTAIDITHSGLALADWLRNCPRSVYWEGPRHRFWSALLHANYYTTLCLLHRAHMPPPDASGPSTQSQYPSRNIAFQAAAMITSIVDCLASHDQLRFCPAFIVYSLFSALIMHVYQLRSPIPSIQQVTNERLRTCMLALKEVSKVWLVGKMVYTLFESLLGNRVLEERLQKAGRKRHRKSRPQQAFARLETPQPRSPDQSKRKYDEMAADFGMATPAHQESYERSRPQTPNVPSAPASRNGTTLPPPATGHPTTATTPPLPHQGLGRLPTGEASQAEPPQPTTPFNYPFSLPATPPDFYLVTRNSPNISHTLWENFQPDQLFPENVPAATVPPPLGAHHGLDPGIMAQQLGTPDMQPRHQASGTIFQHDITSNKPPSFEGDMRQLPRGVAGGLPSSNTELDPTPAQYLAGSSGVQATTFDGPSLDGQSPDSWSAGSSSSQPIPATLNVEEWFNFFGINNDPSSIYADAI